MPTGQDDGGDKGLDGQTPSGVEKPATGRIVIMVVGEMARARETGIWQLFIQW